MRILMILKGLFQKENQDFIRESYRQLLNREPNPHELEKYSLQMARGISKKAIVKNLLESQEARNLYGDPIQTLANINTTVANIFRTFYSSNTIYFVRNVYKEILGYDLQRQPDIHVVQSLTSGRLSRVSFICSLIENNNQLTSSIPLPNRHNKENKATMNIVQGFYPSTREWVKEFDLPDNLINLYSDESLPSLEPKGLDKDMDWGSLIMVKEIPQPFVANVPNGMFFGGNGGAVIIPEGKILADISHEMDIFQDEFRFSLFANKPVPLPSHYPGNVAVLRARYDINYFHWMFDVASRIDLLRKCNVPIDKFIINSPFPYQDELLTQFGIPREKRLQTTIQMNIKAQQLLVPSYTGSSLGIVPKWACDFLRKELVLNRNIEKLHGFERIYISRLNATHRKVINNDEVMKVLSSHGFKQVFLEKESMARKIQLLHSAEIVIAPHGAGLTNLIFCKPGTKVIEIFHPKWILPCYWMISSHVGLDYYYLTGKGERSGKRLDIRKIRENIFVDTDELIQTLQLSMTEQGDPKMEG